MAELKVETYESYIEGLDYKNYAAFVARHAKSGKACVVGYAPNNGTNYTLVFTPILIDPLREISYDHPGDDAIVANWGYSEGMTGITKQMIESDQIWAYVGWLNHGCYLIRLDGFNHWSYIMEKFSIGDHVLGDAYALTALFSSIAEQLPTFDKSGVYTRGW